jgi:hypothetical protein
MAKRITVQRLMREYLEENAEERLEDAGDTWPQQLMGFYFPENEDTVDLCALTVLQQALALDGTTVPTSVRKGVRETVNTDTLTSDAITIIWLATFVPV